MPYNQKLADRVRERFEHLPNVEEKNMMGGLCIMYNDKMCVGVLKDDLMVRIDPEVYDASLERRGCRQMDFTGTVLKGFVLIDETGTGSKKDFDYWVDLALDFNPRAKSSKKKKK
ncbi:MAG: TfoX family protein [Sphingobacteriales bacterium]|nr:MAG: TfoX family protein [Sphingobacteriales bacterium]